MVAGLVKMALEVCRLLLMLLAGLCLRSLVLGLEVSLQDRLTQRPGCNCDSKDEVLSANFDLLDGVSCTSSAPRISLPSPTEFRPFRLLLVERFDTLFLFNISLNLRGAVGE